VSKGRSRDGVWKYSYGVRPYVVFAMERRDRAGHIAVRWTNPDKTGKFRRERKTLGITVRDPETGRLDRRRVRVAELAVQQFQAKLVVGQPARPTAASANNTPSATQTWPVESPRTGHLILRAGFDLALDPVRGKYGSIRTRRYDQMVKYRERLFGGKRHAMGLLDPSLAWTEFVPAEARALWRKMADRHAASRGAEFGVRAAEGMVDAIYSVAAWLREHRIPADAARPPAQWRKSLKEEWAQRTGKRRSRPHRPRHTVEEYRRIFAATTDPRIDPRIRLAIELAAECRTGQVLRCTRRMLVLPGNVPNDFESAPPGSLGQIEIPGAGKKHGEVVVFTPEQRRAVDDALGGTSRTTKPRGAPARSRTTICSPARRCGCSTRAVGGGPGRSEPASSRSHATGLASLSGGWRRSRRWSTSRGAAGTVCGGSRRTSPNQPRRMTA
jgi:hypothetical protein